MSDKKVEVDVDLLLDLKQKLSDIENLSESVKTVASDVKDIKKATYAVSTLTAKEVFQLKQIIDDRETEREFWKDRKAQLATAGLIGACSIVVSALFYYLQHLLSNGSGG